MPLHWYVVLGARKGAAAVLKKYGSIGGDPGYRKRKWHEWWEKEGRYRPNSIIKPPLPFKKPRFSAELAEFVGILLGDGGMTKYQIIISLNSKDEKEYSEFVLSLAKKLFDVYVSTYHRKEMSVIMVRISRSGIIRFCVDKLGLKTGNKIKQQVDIPNWIKRNRRFSIACIRGLVDTDGCLFNHNYKVNGKLYSYKKLAFTSFSAPLRRSVFRVLKSLGMNPRLDRKDIRLESEEDVRRYFSIVGTHNRKLLNKYLIKVYVR
jgi:intein/homing endonuclease